MEHPYTPEIARRITPKEIATMRRVIEQHRLSSLTLAGLLSFTQACVGAERHILPDEQTDQLEADQEPYPAFEANFEDATRQLRTLTQRPLETSLIAQFPTSEQPWLTETTGQWRDASQNASDETVGFNINEIVQSATEGESIMVCHTHPIENSSQFHMAQSETISLIDMQTAFIIEQMLVAHNTTQHVDLCVITPSGTYIIDLHPEHATSPEAIGQTEQILGNLEMRRLNMMFQPDAFESYTPVTPTSNIPENNVRLNTDFAEQFSAPLFTITFRPHTP